MSPFVNNGSVQWELEKLELEESCVTARKSSSRNTGKTGTLGPNSHETSSFTVLERRCTVPYIEWYRRGAVWEGRWSSSLVSMNLNWANSAHCLHEPFAHNTFQSLISGLAVLRYRTLYSVSITAGSEIKSKIDGGKFRQLWHISCVYCLTSCKTMANEQTMMAVLFDLKQLLIDRQAQLKRAIVYVIIDGLMALHDIIFCHDKVFFRLNKKLFKLLE